jgi:hypothetical protein
MAAQTQPLRHRTEQRQRSPGELRRLRAQPAKALMGRIGAQRASATPSQKQIVRCKEAAKSRRSNRKEVTATMHADDVDELLEEPARQDAESASRSAACRTPEEPGRIVRNMYRICCGARASRTRSFRRLRKTRNTPHIYEAEFPEGCNHVHRVCRMP